MLQVGDELQGLEAYPDQRSQTDKESSQMPEIGADNRPLKVLLAAPRGFCAGVDRAIQIVEQALEKYGKPVYVRHEIVHNRFVVESLEARGAIFVDELDAVPGDRPVIFSAHGVPKSVPAEAGRRNLLFLDATCPLVSKVHNEAAKHFGKGHEIVLIGHAGHPEVIGTMGQLPHEAISLVETSADAQAFEPRGDGELAWITQTTLSVDDTNDIVEILKRRFPSIIGPGKEDICYATTNRQQAVKMLAQQCDLILVIGAPNSSNSMRLVEVATQAGCPKSMLVQRASDIDFSILKGVNTLGVTAGASAPDILVDEVLDACRGRFDVQLEEISVTTENVSFKLPKELH